MLFMAKTDQMLPPNSFFYTFSTLLKEDSKVEDINTFVFWSGVKRVFQLLLITYRKSLI